MRIWPTGYQELELKEKEKEFVEYCSSSDEYGHLLLNVNPVYLKGYESDVMVLHNGVAICRFMDNFDVSFLTSYVEIFRSAHKKIISRRLLNINRFSEAGKLKFPVAIVHIFPDIKKSEIEEQNLLNDEDLKEFVENDCLFYEDVSVGKPDFINLIKQFLGNRPVSDVSDNPITIDDSNINDIVSKIAPGYIIPVVNIEENEETSPVEDGEVDRNDRAVKAFSLDDEQINIVNDIRKGDRLILACAGSGKSTLLISKCFKVASLNPDKNFLITCFNNNLQTLYNWYIETAGLNGENVRCLTFHSLCKYLLNKNRITFEDGDFNSWPNKVIESLYNGRIEDRFYGIFIDEAQIFEPEWYTICYNLLEDPNPDYHFFVICGDKTQKIRDCREIETAPWENAGEGYPVFDDSNTIRINTNYRNCIEINDFINRYTDNAKKYLNSVAPELDIDKDMFLRGEAKRHGTGVEYCLIEDFNNDGEADAIIASINKIHNEHKIPYSQIAVVMFNESNGNPELIWRRNDGKLSETYAPGIVLMKKLEKEKIPFCRLYNSEDEIRGDLIEDRGIRLVKFESALGLDFKAVIICGLKPLGYIEGVKTSGWASSGESGEDHTEYEQDTLRCINKLYVACTRAKDVLHIIASEPEEDSVFMKMLKDSVSENSNENPAE
ncbi:MAG: AAA family ATPase [Oscillospiraceae bacterium]|nr:AAA family ATPase [Oscillospiraceae bacterium]